MVDRKRKAAMPVVIDKQFIFNFSCFRRLLRLTIKNGCYRELYWLLWLLQYEALNGYYANWLLLIAWMRKLKFVAIFWKWGKSMSFSVIFDFDTVECFFFFLIFFIFGLTKNRPLIFDILSSTHAQSLKKRIAVLIRIALNKQFIFKIKYSVVFDNYRYNDL